MRLGLSAPPNALTSSLSLTGLEATDWAIVSTLAADDWCLLNPTTEQPAEEKDYAQKKPGYVQWVLYNRFLQDAVFGPKELLAGLPQASNHPLRGLVARFLEEGRHYLSHTTYQKVSIPYSKDKKLSGLLFGKYDANGASMPFDKSELTCLVLSGSYAPSDAYMMGIVEGYRQQGVQVLSVDYIGFGENAALGPPSQTNVFASAEASMQYLLSLGVFDDRVIVHGYSVGGFPAAMLAARFNVHLVIDRTSISTEEIAYTMLQSPTGSRMVTRCAIAVIAKLAMYGVPFSIKEPICKVKRHIFVVQEQCPETEKIGALPYIQKLLSSNALATSQVVLKWIENTHLSSPRFTWTVDSNKFAEKFGLFPCEYIQEKSREAREAWQLFIQGIRIHKV